MDKKNWLKLLGIFAFAWILYIIDLPTLGRSLIEIDLLYLVFIIPLFFLLILVKTLRWSTILKSRDISLPIFGLFSAYMSGFFTGGVTPGKVGELLKYKYVRENNHSLGESISSAIGDRLWDFGFLVVVGWLGFPFVYPLSDGQKLITLISIIGGVLSVYLLIKFKGRMVEFIEKKSLNLVPAEYREKLRQESARFMRTILPGSLSDFTKLFIYTTLSWILYYIHFYLLSLSLHMNVDIFNLSLVLSVAALFSLLPITISGIGTRDAALIFLLSPFGISSEKAVAFSLSILAVFVLEIAIGFLFWMAQGQRSLS